MSLCEYRYLRRQWLALAPNVRHLWLRENAAAVAHMETCNG